MSALDPALGAAPNSWRGDAVERAPVPTLYQSEGSYYSQLARLCLVEKGLPWKSRLLDLHSVALDQARLSATASGWSLGLRAAHRPRTPACASSALSERHA